MSSNTTSIDHLLIPRYKVLAPWPEMERWWVRVGDILTEGIGYETTRNQNGDAVPTFEWETFPHLFKKLEWWEEREKEELPMYVKQTGMVDSFEKPVPDWYLKVKKHWTVGNGTWRDDSKSVFWAVPDERTIGFGMNYRSFEPATETDYLTYINSKK